MTHGEQVEIQKGGSACVRSYSVCSPLRFSMIILFGILLMQVEFLADFELRFLLIGVLPVLLAAFAYPLGNRKMMAHTDLDVFERILGMCIGSLPLWLLLFGYGLTTGAPSGSQLIQTLLVALLSGVVATVLFFKATDLVKHDMGKLATVEATQALEVLFALIGELFLLGAHLPSGLSLVGITLVMIGVVLHSRSQFRLEVTSGGMADRYEGEGR